MNNNTLAAIVLVEKPLAEVWEMWITPSHITRWNIPFDNWRCPLAENDLMEHGKFLYRMESCNGEDGFDHKGQYTRIIPGRLIECMLEDGRRSCVEFQQIDQNTIVRESFEPEPGVPADMQQQFSQLVLERFKEYAESASL